MEKAGPIGLTGLMPRPRILVIDEHAIARLSAAQALNAEEVEAVPLAPDAFAAGGWPPGPAPALAIVGASAPDRDAFPILRAVAARLPGTPVLLFAIEPQSLRLGELATLGVVGSISKNILPSALRRAVATLLAAKS